MVYLGSGWRKRSDGGEGRAAGRNRNQYGDEYGNQYTDEYGDGDEHRHKHPDADAEPNEHGHVGDQYSNKYGHEYGDRHPNEHGYSRPVRYPNEHLGYPAASTAARGSRDRDTHGHHGSSHGDQYAGASGSDQHAEAEEDQNSGAGCYVTAKHQAHEVKALGPEGTAQDRVWRDGAGSRFGLSVSPVQRRVLATTNRWRIA
jgi:hypothetical protein